MRNVHGITRLIFRTLTRADFAKWFNLTLAAQHQSPRTSTKQQQDAPKCPKTDEQDQLYSPENSIHGQGNKARDAHNYKDKSKLTSGGGKPV